MCACLCVCGDFAKFFFYFMFFFAGPRSRTVLENLLVAGDILMDGSEILCDLNLGRGPILESLGVAGLPNFFG